MRSRFGDGTSIVLAAALALALAGCEEAETGAPSTGGLAINEILASPDEGGSDWVELVATGSEPVDLSRFALADEGHDAQQLPDQMLGVGEFFVIVASDDPPEDGSPHLAFQLGRSDGLSLTLDGEVVDTLSWDEDDLPDGASFGRLPDGDGAQQALLPTRGEPNAPYEEEEDPPEGDLFPQDRVVEVRLELAAEDWEALLADPLAETYYPADLAVDGVTVTNVGLRTKGNSSLRYTVESGSIRYPFKVDINTYESDQTLFGERKFSLSPSFKDPTYMRETLAYALAREIGVPAPQTAYADLFINGEHMGLYVLVEEVDADFVEERFEDDDGDLYKPEPPSGNLGYMGDSIEAYEGLELQTNEETSDSSAFLNLISVLEQGDPALYASVLDIDEVLRYLALNTLLVNLDSYSGPGHNYYLYEQDGVFSVILWDPNEAFGTFSCSCDRAGVIGFLVDEPTCGPIDEKPLIQRLLSVPELGDAYHQALRDLIAGPFSFDAMQERISGIAALIRPYVENDPTSHFTVEDFDIAVQADLQFPGGRGTSIGLITFVAERAESVTAQLDGEIPSSGTGQGSCGSAGPPPTDEPPTDPPPDGPCGDGVCDEIETANPTLCPLDCE